MGSGVYYAGVEADHRSCFGAAPEPKPLSGIRMSHSRRRQTQRETHALLARSQNKSSQNESLQNESFENCNTLQGRRTFTRNIDTADPLNSVQGCNRILQENGCNANEEVVGCHNDLQDMCHARIVLWH